MEDEAILQYHVVTLLALLWGLNKNDFVAEWFEFELERQFGCHILYLRRQRCCDVSEVVVVVMNVRSVFSAVVGRRPGSMLTFF
jgi:hypothetical protein